MRRGSSLSLWKWNPSVWKLLKGLLGNVGNCSLKCFSQNWNYSISSSFNSWDASQTVEVFLRENVNKHFRMDFLFIFLPWIWKRSFFSDVFWWMETQIVEPQLPLCLEISREKQHSSSAWTSREKRLILLNPDECRLTLHRDVFFFFLSLSVIA